MSGGHVRPAANILLVWREGWVGVNFCLVSLSLSLSPSLSFSFPDSRHTFCAKRNSSAYLSPPVALSLSLVRVHFHMFESEDSSLFPDTQRLLSKTQLRQQHLKVSNHYCLSLSLSLSVSH
ncbi:hypothetical protein QQF64_018143 [Cirrhinus molitorella]|uniref:Uncharacterized protein n=1 Tax=Cirrhinus molitorella TaxID=172907 RepID=A0ABR3LM90_9TELE